MDPFLFGTLAAASKVCASIERKKEMDAFRASVKTGMECDEKIVRLREKAALENTQRLLMPGEVAGEYCAIEYRTRIPAIPGGDVGIWYTPRFACTKMQWLRYFGTQRFCDATYENSLRDYERSLDGWREEWGDVEKELARFRLKRCPHLYTPENVIDDLKLCKRLIQKRKDQEECKRRDWLASTAYKETLWKAALDDWYQSKKRVGRMKPECRKYFDKNAPDYEPIEKYYRRIYWCKRYLPKIILALAIIVPFCATLHIHFINPYHLDRNMQQIHINAAFGYGIVVWVVYGVYRYIRSVL